MVAHTGEARITTGGTRSVGIIRVDGGTLRGEGGPSNPRLVIPVEVRMASRPKASVVALVRLVATLSTAEHSPDSVVGSPASCDLTDGFPCRSVEWGETSHRLDLPFVLTPYQVAMLEACRHAAPSETFVLHLRLEGTVAGVRASNEVSPGGAAEDESPWETGLGMYTQLFPFWQSRIDPLRLEVELSTWVRDVLPGLGLDRSRLVEVAFPPALSGGESAAREWDKAREAFDARRYRDCIERCRGVIRLWVDVLDASTKRPVATIIAERQGWPNGDPRHLLIDKLWRAATDFANLPHHPEASGSDLFEVGAAEARLFLLLIATLSEYLGATR